ncbi:hypothetical protein LMG28727_05509 [Paraburkholderia kirstenboschensis]|uniref:hypothetical protein n=1 Tax=Paraburkholderia kirstenboschensis TaxID=1245436 RepID=UPI000A6429F6|nr:hypothetical protein [Paraburkholderia kirstenboschensis]CAD6553244.1 hypothetical protein LMG28727_05509 [Paraburkholderia kirstenboschensis]
MKDELLTKEVALGFQEAELLSVEHHRLKSELRTTFALRDADVRAICCGGIHALRASDIIRHNVVSRVLLSSWHQFADGELTTKVNWANSLNGTEVRLGSSTLTRYEENIACGDWNLLVIEPSYGAEIVVVCDRVAVTGGVEDDDGRWLIADPQSDMPALRESKRPSAAPSKANLFLKAGRYR